MQNPKPINKLFNNHEAIADQFMALPNIVPQIRSHLKKFVNYCHTHKVFTSRLIQLAFDVSYQELQDQSLKKASFAANQLFANEEPEIAELFFQPPPQEEDDSTEIKQQITQGIQSQAERLFNFDSDEEEKTEEQRQVEITRQQLVSLSLQILKRPQKNETCLGHLQKMYSFIIRHQPTPVLSYFSQNRQKLQLLIKNISFSSISSLISQLLTCQDKKKEYKYQSLKKQILEKINEELFKNISNQCYFDGAIILIDQILNATKQSYFEYFQDFKRVSNYMVSEVIIKKCYQILNNVEQTSFCNVSRWLEVICNRINSQNEDNRYYHKEDNQPTMTFQIQILVTNINKLIQLCFKAHHFNSITKIHYLAFLQALLNTGQVKSISVSILQPPFLALLDAYKLQSSGGICKNKLYHIIKQLLVRASQDELKSFIQKHPQVYEQYFNNIKTANYSNTRSYNKNESSGYDVDIIAKLTKREQERLLTASKVIGKDLKRICRKYDTKIASFVNSTTFSLEDQFNFYGFDGSKSNQKEGGLTVGKNNISIPVLHLPDRYQNVQSNDKSQINERKGSGSPDLSPTQLQNSSLEREQVVEVEEVVSLTNKITEDKVINLSEVINSNIQKFQQERKNEKAPVNSPIKDEKKEDISETQAKKKALVPSLNLKDLSQKQPQKVGQSDKQPQKIVQVMQPKIGDLQRTKFYARHLTIFA